MQQLPAHATSRGSSIANFFPLNIKRKPMMKTILFVFWLIVGVQSLPTIIESPLEGEEAAIQESYPKDILRLGSGSSFDSSSSSSSSLSSSSSRSSVFMEAVPLEPQFVPGPKMAPHKEIFQSAQMKRFIAAENQRFVLAAKTNDFATMLEIFGTVPIACWARREAFLTACELGHLSMADLVRLQSPSCVHDYDRALWSVVQNNHSHMIPFLKRHGSHILSRRAITGAMVDSIESYHIETLFKLLQNFQLDPVELGHMSEYFQIYWQQQ